MSEFAVSDFTVDGPYGLLRGKVWPGGRDKCPILLLHDSIGSVVLWRDFPQALCEATGRTVIAYDRAGFGLSVPRQAQVAHSFIRDEALEGIVPVLDALGINRAILFGHSVGGGMALSAAAVIPDRVQAVVTVSAQAFVEDRTLAGVRQAKQAFAEPEQFARLQRYHGARTGWALEAWIETWLDEGYADWSLQPLLADIRVPVLVLHGDGDEYGSLAHPERIGRGVTDARVRIFEGVGHMPHREVTADVLAEVRAFLNHLA